MSCGAPSGRTAETKLARRDRDHGRHHPGASGPHDRHGRADERHHSFYYGSSPEELPRLPLIEAPASASSFVSKDVGARTALPFITHINAAKLTTTKEIELL